MYTTTESPEVAAYAAEPPEVVAPSEISLEVAADAAEAAAELTLAPCTVVVSVLNQPRRRFVNSSPVSTQPQGLPVN